MAEFVKEVRQRCFPVGDPVDMSLRLYSNGRIEVKCPHLVEFMMGYYCGKKGQPSLLQAGIWCDLESSWRTPLYCRVGVRTCPMCGGRGTMMQVGQQGQVAGGRCPTCGGKGRY